jgi:hypothetical protein
MKLLRHTTGTSLLSQGLTGVLLACVATSPSLAGDSSANPTSSQARVDEILTKLESRSAGLLDIRCKVEFVEDDRINLSLRKKYGTILFMLTKPNPSFLIHFERTELVTDGILGKQEWYLFDGRWLHQAIERTKQVTIQEIVRPGQRVDLFDLENTPFPLPFGQKKEKILKSFDVTLVAPAHGDPAGTDHLVCIPRADSRLRDKYDKLEFFILKDIHLPSRVVVTKSNGYEISRADFPDLSAKSINAGVTKKDFAIPKAWRKYEEVVEPLPPEPE